MRVPRAAARGAALTRADRLLDLHRNVTVVQQRLAEALDAALCSAREAQDEVAAGWRGFVGRMGREMESVEREVVETVRGSGKAMDWILKDILKTFAQGQQDGLEAVERLGSVCFPSTALSTRSELLLMRAGSFDNRGASLLTGPRRSTMHPGSLHKMQTAQS